MATKKQVPKKLVKAAKPAKKAVAKKQAPLKKTVKPVQKKAAPAVKKTVKPLAKKHILNKSIHKPVEKHPAKKVVEPLKKNTVSKGVVAKHPEPLKNVESHKELAKQVEPAKKPSISAPTHHEVKPVIKPLEKPAVKKETPKPTKVVIPKTSTTRIVKYDPDFTRSVLDSPHFEHSGPSMRYSDPELEEFRELINKKLETAKKELAYLQGLITRKDEGGDMEDGRYMTMEDGSMSMEREQLSQMASRQIQFIDHLEKAIMRIENKTYGICRITGKLIDKARLRAVPHATLSIEAKQMMNK
ncbi:MAG: hypothetical protein NVS1B13_07480 [Flavisolibacter sp.]